jgi:hypothetical protein
MAAERAKDVANRSVDPNEILGYLQSKGVSKNHALGMLANIQYESGFNSTITEGGKNGGGGVGLFQHTGPRRKALENYLNGDMTNWKGQIDFALSEGSSKNYLTKNFNSPEQASHYFTTQWERPANAAVRGVQRQGFFKNFEGGKYATETYNPSNLDVALDNSPIGYSDRGSMPQSASSFEVLNASSENGTPLTAEEFRKQLEIETAKIEKEKNSAARQELAKEQNKNEFITALSKITYNTDDPNAKATENGKVDMSLYVQNLPFEAQQVGNLFTTGVAS